MTIKILLAALALPVTAACGTADPPPPGALNVTCEPGGRHGPSGVMDWTCIDGDGQRRLPVRSLHEVIEGAPRETEGSSGA